MSYLLRAVHDRTLWDRELFPTWVNVDDLPSCIVNDLHADDNSLSLWEIQDEEVNLTDVITAIASKQPGSRTYFDFALLKTALVQGTLFNLAQEDGNTPYVDANRYHFTLSKLSLHQLTYFAHLLCKSGDFRRTSYKDVRKSLLDVHSKGKLDLQLVPKGLKKELGIIP